MDILQFVDEVLLLYNLHT